MLAVTSCGMQGVTPVSSEGKIDSSAEGFGGPKGESDEQVAEQFTDRLLVDITMEGGTGKASVNSPVEVRKENGNYTATLVWSSKNYDYVIVDGKRYENENPGGYSTFTVPVRSLDEPFSFTADTLAMSKPHEIEYRITWNEVVRAGETEAAGDTLGTAEEEGTGFDKAAFNVTVSDREVTDLPGLERTGEVPLKYAKGFEISKYGAYSLVTIHGVGSYLVVPKGESVPETDPKVTILKQPLERTYLVSTSAMDLVRQLGRLDSIRFSPLRADEWDIPEVRELMDSGNMKYAGKYRMPDYELLVGDGCDLVVENTMIYHDPEVTEKLEELGIPVLIETSSYESDPLGRLEWIKLYGVLFDREKEASDYFDSAALSIEELGSSPSGGKKVACFYVSATGMVHVRGSGDYMADMIRLAGGKYVPSGDSATTSSVNMQMEDFYAAASDADVLIYNGTIDGELASVEDLVEKNSLFADFTAVKNSNVYCLKGDLFRHPTDMAEFIEELGAILSDPGVFGTDGSANRDFKYIYRPVQ